MWRQIINTILLIWRISRTGNLGAFMASVFGGITILGWLLTFVIGPFAATQLWRLRDSGRRTSLLLALFAFLYYIVAWLFFREPDAKLSTVLVPVVGNALFVALLLSPAARRTYLGSKNAGRSDTAS
jgi:hypothetical protein